VSATRTIVYCRVSLAKMAEKGVSLDARQAIGERTSAALQHKASQGEYTGGDAPYGFRLSANGQRLETHRREQALVK
jgi:DNA invertase Pin-like site-specific DNA recombinase